MTVTDFKGKFNLLLFRASSCYELRDAAATASATATAFVALFYNFTDLLSSDADFKLILIFFLLFLDYFKNVC